MVKEKILKAIADNSLIEKNESILVAFSGGADSVCLLYMLNELSEKLGCKLYAAHLNHCIRGEQADVDEEFSKSFCEKLGIECITFRRDVGEYAARCGISEELAGREVRYSLFFDIIKSRNIQKLAVGHHMDDQAETVLMHLLRGSGSDGLSGMRYRRGQIIRPMLDVSKDEILQLCREENLHFCTDSTNFETDYTRNRIRLELIPKLREFNNGIRERLSETAEIIGSENDFLDEVSEKEFRRLFCDNSISIQELNKNHIAVRRRVIRKLIESSKNEKRDIGFDYISKIVEIIYKGRTGSSIDIGDGFKAFIDYDSLVVKKAEKQSLFHYMIKPGEQVYITERACNVCIVQGSKVGFDFPDGAELVLRNRCNGDRIYPVGMDGSKKLKDFFIDMKISREQREQAIILTCNGEIAFIRYGQRHFEDRRFFGKGSYTVDISFDSPENENIAVK